MHIQRYIPTRLHGLVHLIWEQRAEQPMRWQILPSGCVELIFRLGPKVDEMQARALNSHINPTAHTCFLSGLHTWPLYLNFSRFHFIGMQMSPIAVKALFGLPCVEVVDWALDGELLLRQLDEIEDRLMVPGDFLTKARWLENHFLARINETAELHLALQLSRAVRKLDTEQPDKQRALQRLIGYSRTHTHRLFTGWFGLAPGYHLRLTQYLSVLQSLHCAPGRLTDLAYGHGYFDQAHFIRSFRHFTNMTPGQYRKNMSGLIGQLPWR